MVKGRLDDKVHDTFLVVVQAIRRGELRDPQRLMGFVRTVVRRQVAAHIDKVVAATFVGSTFNYVPGFLHRGQPLVRRIRSASVLNCLPRCQLP